ncbi:MAG: type VII secretion protein EccB [Mycobacterium sp.]
MSRQPTTWLQVSGYRFLLRRIESALLTGRVDPAGLGVRRQSAPLVIGCVLAAVATAGCGLLALLRPQPSFDDAQIVMTRESGALYVRVGDVWHPVLNLSSARLIAATPANPRPVRESDLARTKRGPLLGIPGAPQLLGTPLSGDESSWTVCDTDASGATTVIVGRVPTSSEGEPVHRLPPDRAVLVASPPGSPAYLLYNGQRAVVDLADTSVLRALRLEGRAPRPVSQALLNAIPEAPPIAPPKIPGTGDTAPALPGFAVGSVLRIARADGDEYYAVLPAGVQRIGQVAADLLRFGNSRGTANAITVAPDVLRAAAIADALPVASFPDRAPTLDAGGGVCVTLGRSDAWLLIGSGLPVPPGQAAVILSQADGRGPALDAVYLPPGRSANVRADGRVGTRYLVTDTGTRFAVHDDEAAHDLGLPAATPAPWRVLAALPSGPELSRQKASVARDAVTGSP